MGSRLNAACHAHEGKGPDHRSGGIAMSGNNSQEVAAGVWTADKCNIS